jgi:hypothetical protein
MQLQIKTLWIRLFLALTPLPFTAGQIARDCYALTTLGRHLGITALKMKRRQI